MYTISQFKHVQSTASAISVLTPAECGISAASRFSFLRLPCRGKAKEGKPWE